MSDDKFDLESALDSKDPYRSTNNTENVLEEIRRERIRQDEKWGEQNHPLVPPLVDGLRPAGVMIRYGLRREKEAKQYCSDEHQQGKGTYMSILVEEVCEAVEAACVSEEVARAELVQVAAVAVAMIEAIDRRSGRGR